MFKAKLTYSINIKLYTDSMDVKSRMIDQKVKNIDVTLA
jgi:hypothetical protein